MSLDTYITKVINLLASIEKINDLNLKRLIKENIDLIKVVTVRGISYINQGLQSLAEEQAIIRNIQRELGVLAIKLQAAINDQISVSESNTEILASLLEETLGVLSLRNLRNSKASRVLEDSFQNLQKIFDVLSKLFKEIKIIQNKDVFDQDDLIEKILKSVSAKIANLKRREYILANFINAEDIDIYQQLISSYSICLEQMYYFGIHLKEFFFLKKMLNQACKKDSSGQAQKILSRFLQEMESLTSLEQFLKEQNLVEAQKFSAEFFAKELDLKNQKDNLIEEEKFIQEVSCNEIDLSKLIELIESVYMDLLEMVQISLAEYDDKTSVGKLTKPERKFLNYFAGKIEDIRQEFLRKNVKIKSKITSGVEEILFNIIQAKLRNEVFLERAVAYTHKLGRGEIEFNGKKYSVPTHIQSIFYAENFKQIKSQFRLIRPKEYKFFRWFERKEEVDRFYQALKQCCVKKLEDFKLQTQNYYIVLSRNSQVNLVKEVIEDIEKAFADFVGEKQNDQKNYPSVKGMQPN